ncbi:MAG: ANTAR domain-containing protein [Gemmataceae bacterium]
MQKIWLLEDEHAGDAASLCPVLQKLVEKHSERILFLGSSPAKLEHVKQIRDRQPDVVVINEDASLVGRALNELADLNACFLIVTSLFPADRFDLLAKRHSVSFIPSSSGPECLAMALHGLAYERIREEEWQAQVTALQHRLNDRIVIERAKGILIQKLGITEDEAYKRLRLSSRRQRRQIRDIAQSLLDTQALLSPEGSGTTANQDLGLSPCGGLENVMDNP